MMKFEAKHGTEERQGMKTSGFYVERTYDDGRTEIVSRLFATQAEAEAVAQRLAALPDQSA
jgi:hypothetical protein